MNSLKWRSFKNKAYQGFLFLLAAITVTPLFLILFYIFKNGLKYINWNFFISLPAEVGESGGGIVNSLVGTFELILIAAVFAVPVGILTAIFINEHKKNKLSDWIRISVDILQGIPSIVIGILAYTWIVVPLGHFSAFSGGIALGFMMLPVVIKSTEETLKLIPNSLKEASLSLGVPYHKTILKVILPSSLSGIMTGVLIGIARIAGETAPLLFTAFGNPFLSTALFQPIDSLPLLIFNYATSPYDEWHNLAWGASVVLIVFILGLNIITRMAVKKWKVQF